MLSPAQFIIDNYLDRAISESDGDVSQRDFRLDILYLLTDKYAHRRALRLGALAEEVNQLAPSEFRSGEITPKKIKETIEPLQKHGLVRRYETADEDQFELAHDYLVRSILKAWRDLDRRRTEELALKRRQRQTLEEKIPRLEALETRARMAVCSLPAVVWLLLLWLAFICGTGKLPPETGLSVLWIIAVPAIALVIAAVVAGKGSLAILFASLSLAACGGIWLYEHSLPTVKPAWMNTYLSTPTLPDRLEMRSYSLCRSLIYRYKRYPEKNEFTPNDSRFCYEFVTQYSPEISEELKLFDEHLSRLNEHLNSFSIRPYQGDSIDGSKIDERLTFFVVGLLALLFAVYPGILVREGLISSEKPRWILSLLWADVIDILGIISVAALCLVLIGFYHWHIRTLPIALIGYLVVATFFTYRMNCTLGMRIAGLIFLQDTYRPSIIKLILRQIIMVIWSLLNGFFFIPVIVVAIVYAPLKKSAGTFYDGLLRLAITYRPVKKTIAADVLSATGASTTLIRTR